MSVHLIQCADTSDANIPLLPTILGHPIRQTSCVALSLADNVCSNIIQRAQLKTSCRKTLTYILKLCVFVYAITCVRFSHYAIVFSCTRILLYHITSTAELLTARIHSCLCPHELLEQHTKCDTHAETQTHAPDVVYAEQTDTADTRNGPTKKKLSLTNASTINIARYATATQRTVPRATRAQHTDSVRRRSALGTAVSGKWYIRAQSGNERTRDAHTTSSYLICVQLTRESCVERTRSPKNCARLAGVRVRVVRVRPPLIVFVL